jgi:hypothetical protein
MSTIYHYPEKICVFCGEDCKGQEWIGSGGYEYRCRNCGNYLLCWDIAKVIKRDYADKTHFLAGYLFNTKADRDYDITLKGLSMDAKIPLLDITRDKLDAILNDLIPKTAKRLESLLLFLYARNERFGQEHPIRSIYPYAVYARDLDEVAAMLAELSKRDYIDIAKDERGLIRCARIASLGFEIVESMEDSGMDNISTVATSNESAGLPHSPRLREKGEESTIIAECGYEKKGTRQMDNYCFVIQPFDNGKFDKRYDDTFAPAIEKAGIKPYRVDKDPSATVPIDTIEKRIKNSKFCLADITTDNPNVWYEVGYAMAAEKDVILICCSNERTGQYPFDIRHRSIINYKSESSRDYEQLMTDIVNKATILMKKQLTPPRQSKPNATTNELEHHEIALIGAILMNQDSPADGCSVYCIKDAMRKSGFSDVAFNIASRMLHKKGFIETITETDHYDKEYSAHIITETGDSWVLENADRFDTSSNLKSHNEVVALDVNDDELPF